MKLPRRASARSRQRVLWLWLLLATFMSTLCMASMPFEGDGLYDGLLGIDIETAKDVLSLQGDASHLVSRQVNETRQLTDNSISPREIVPGDLDFWTFPASQWNSSKTKNNSTLYLTVSACTQPFPRTGLNATEVYGRGSPPALRLYVSTDPSNKQPGPSSDPARQNMTELSYGFANMTLVLQDITKDVYITVASQNISSDWQGTWTYQIGASTQEFQQNVEVGENLWVIDTSQGEALITTGNLTSSVPQPFQIYAVRKDQDHIFSALSNSFCAFRSNPSLLTTANADISMTTRGVGGLPKQQFFLEGLNASTSYNIYLTLAQNGSSVAGTVFAPSASFTTKTSNNCQLIFNLEFCTEIAYAVPANPNIFTNSSSLATFYDSSSSTFFDDFAKTLQMQPCNTTASAQFSLFRNCTTCLTAYKNWLCAVTIPRCADVTDPSPYLFDRPVNSSRLGTIDQIVQPGAYKELMPCSDLCWGIEQNCPSTLGFNCPDPGSEAMANSYVEDKTGKTCNAPQLQYLASSGVRLRMGHWVLMGFLVHLAFWIVWER